MLNRLISFILLLFIISINAYVQEPLRHEEKVFLGNDGKLYVNKNLPVYLRLAVSPDKDAATYLLKSDSSRPYTNPMYFDSEGRNTIRSPWAVDTATKRTVSPKQEIVFEVYADGLPPTSTLKFDGNRPYEHNGTRYYGSSVKFSVSAIDWMSGLQNTYLSINREPYKKLDGSPNLTKEGNYILQYYSVDNVGNTEKPKTEEFVLDLTPPTTQYEIDGMLNEKFVSPDATIKLSSTDSLSGVNKIYYKVNDGSMHIYTTPVPVKLLGNEGGSITYYAIDRVGNKEQEKRIGGKDKNLQVKQSDDPKNQSNTIFEFYIDNAPPEVSVKFDGNFLDGGTPYISPRTKIIFNAEDDKSGVETVYYSFNSTRLDSTYKKPFSISDNGLKYLRFYAKDYVGNRSTVIVKKIYADNLPPVSKISFNGPHNINRDTLFITSATKIEISATDNGSGMETINYNVDNAPYKAYVNTFTLPEPGLHNINYFSTDKVENKEIALKKDVYVDDVPPVINFQFSTTPIGKKSVREEEYTIYPTNVQLYLAATDPDAGLEKIEYQVNGGPVLTEIPLKNLKPGNYEVEVKAIDFLSNTSQKNIKFSIEK